MTMASQLNATMTVRDGVGDVRVEDVFATTITDLWAAITDPTRLSRWLLTATGDLQVGGDFFAEFTSGWRGTGRIETCRPPAQLVAVMMPGSDEETVIEAQLSETAGGVRLVIEERGIPRAELPTHTAGWQAHVEDLAGYLTDGAQPRWAERWAELRSAFAPATKPD